MKIFDFDKEAYEKYVPGHSYFMSRKISIIKKSIRNKNLICLDIGCGSGEIESLLHDNFKEIVGIDSAKNKIKGAKNRKLTNCKFKINKGIKLNFKKNSFDVVLIINVLHHIKHEEHKMLLKGVKRVLKDKGQCLIFEHNPLNPLVWLRFYYFSKIDKGCKMLNPFLLKENLKTIGFRSKLKFIYSEGCGEYYIQSKVM